MDRSAADMTDVEARSLGQALRDALATFDVVNASRCVVAVAALLLVLITLARQVRVEESDPARRLRL